ncbi:MAG: hypothetical protein BM556_10755 [Bacteriovorax sp. MedPE-SWde]|nr:MAG: hypothetical protein BM556_10755 [Bacteriovorax sp. MedPE-SWde]
MLKSILSQILISILGLSLLLTGVYLVLPEMDDLKGKCYYLPSVVMQRKFKESKSLFYLQVGEKEFFRYVVKYSEIKFDEKFLIKKKKDIGEGTLNYIFDQTGYLEMKCPKNVGEYLSFR